MTTRPRKSARALLSLRLYVAGASPNSVLARRNLQAAIAHLPKGEVTVEFIDVLRDPERGLQDGVLVTPTLVKVAPSPERRVIGNLQDHDALMAGLGIGESQDE